MNKTIIEVVVKPKTIVEIEEKTQNPLEMKYMAPGPKGDQGLQGPQGPPGVDGAAGIDSNYVHNQIAASNIWTIEHNLNKKPSVSVVDSADTLIVGNILYLDNNHCQVELSMAISGKAYCN